MGAVLVHPPMELYIRVRVVCMRVRGEAVFSGLGRSLSFWAPCAGGATKVWEGGPLGWAFVVAFTMSTGTQHQSDGPRRCLVANPQPVEPPS